VPAAAVAQYWAELKQVMQHVEKDYPEPVRNNLPLARAKELTKP